ncbi:NAD(P)-dependent oxidoreductase [Psychromonas marina]|uniref:NAD(P)-dependent oxidoreductase n=1 Tax=Psychromonas marina TaxID=88364 RepID=A0ABQ6E4I9_9GAMM|nr:SDR family oxidoreductase [Psychromonas marina]GLS92309.1 NAD(P)-dependent oxidoreductase [Psychromonas marina]
MKIAVTAASGELGAKIVHALLKVCNKEDIIALARTEKKAQSLGVKVRSGDYDAPEKLQDSLQGIDTLLLVSGKEAPELRIQQHRNVLQAAKIAGVSKIVYTSIQGADEGTAFSPVVQSNRQTEEDVKTSGMQWVIGRNGIYIEPDVEYIETYKKAGFISNCAGDGKCGYVTRNELAYAYARMLLEEKHNGQTYNLHGQSITQQQLTDHLSRTFSTNLRYTPLSVAAYRQDRIDELGEFMGIIIAGIYQGIYEGKSDNESQFHLAAGREHQSWTDYFDSLITTSN